MDWSNNVKLILSAGRNLNEIGVNNWGLSKTQALAAIIALENLNIPVIGGDLYQLVNDKPQHTYLNWSCDRTKNENEREYLLRCKTEAIDFINRHSTKFNSEILIALVPNAIVP